MEGWNLKIYLGLWPFYRWSDSRQNIQFNIMEEH